MRTLMSLNSRRVLGIVSLCGVAFFAGKWFGASSTREEIARARPAPPARERTPALASERQPEGAKASDAPELPVLEIAARLVKIGPRPVSRKQAEEMRELLRAWARVDPRAALAHAREDFSPPWRDESTAALLGEWARTDPAAAWAYASEEMGGCFFAVDSVLGAVGASDPRLAWRFAAEHAARAPAEASAAYVAAMKGGMYAGRFAELAGLVGETGLSADEAEAGFGLRGFFAGAWAGEDPEAAADWARGLDPAAPGYRQAMSGLLDILTRAAPGRAAELAAGLPDAADRMRFLRTAADAWTAEHPERAAEWLETRGSGAGADEWRAAVATADRNVDADFARSLAWASGIGDANLRLNSCTRIMERVATRDPDKARAFLRDSPTLPEDLRREIHERLKDVGSLAY